MDRSRLNMRLACVLALAFGLRLTAAIGLQVVLDHSLHRSYLIPGDADGYWHLAEDLAEGREFSIYTPPRRVLRTPGFPAILATSIAAFGDHHLPARILLAAIGTAACVGVYGLARTLFGPKAGLAAAALAAVLPMFVGFTPLILSETAFAAALVVSLIPAVRLLQALRIHETTTKHWLGFAALTGLLIGVANLVRPSWMLAAPIIGVAAIVANRGRAAGWLAAATICGALFLTLLPWGLRNQRITGHLVLTTLWMGPSLYDGLNPEATGDSDMAFFDRDNLLATMSEYDVDREYRDRAWAFARQNPGRAFELGLIKLSRFWKPWPNTSQFSGWPARLVVLASFVPLMLLAAYGFWQARPSWIALAATVGPLLYFSAVHMVFVGSLRYRLPAEYPLAALAGAGWSAWRARAGHESPLRVPADS